MEEYTLEDYEEENISQILNIPSEIFTTILSYCDYKDYNTIYLTCKYFNGLICSDLSWSLIIKEKYPHIYNIVERIIKNSGTPRDIIKLKWKQFLKSMLKDKWNTFYYTEGLIEKNIHLEAIFGNSTTLLKLLVEDEQYIPTLDFSIDFWNIFKHHDFFKTSTSLEFREEYFSILLDCSKFSKWINVKFMC